MHTSRKVAAAALTILFIAASGVSSDADQRPPVIGRSAGVSAGHPLTTAAAFETLMKGGNAFDAGCRPSTSTGRSGRIPRASTS